MGFRNIIYEAEDGVARITINRPPLNILNVETVLEITSALKTAKEDESVSIVLITGAGDRAFSAGAEVRDHMPDRVDMFLDAFDEMFYTLMEIDKPKIAAVNGYALAGGCELAMACDIVVASENARFGVPEINVGVFPPVALVLLPKLVGRVKALELVLTGDTVNAEEAKRLGLVNRVVPADKLGEEVNKVIAKLREKSPIVLKLTRMALYRPLDVEFRKALESVTDIYKGQLMKTEDAIEGLKAFLEKRKPVWKGR